MSGWSDPAVIAQEYWLHSISQSLELFLRLNGDSETMAQYRVLRVYQPAWNAPETRRCVV